MKILDALPHFARVVVYSRPIKRIFEHRGLPVSWGLALAHQDSEFRSWRRTTRIRYGSVIDRYGLMQISLTTAHAMGFRGDRRKLFDVVTNVSLTATFFADMKNKGLSFRDMASMWYEGRLWAESHVDTRMSCVLAIVVQAKRFGWQDDSA